MATTANPWSKPGGWALAAEEEEAQQNLAAAAAAKPIIPNSAFPDLAAAAAAPKTKKKGKGQKLSLSEFNTYDAPKPSTFQPSKGLTHEELAVLPTGPRERTAEEQAEARGFRSYTREEPRRQRESTFAPVSSRADETDDWGAAKKFSPTVNGSDRRERRDGGSFFSDSQSRADEVDNWASRKVAPSTRLPERRSSAFESVGGDGRADADNWVKKKETDFPARNFGSSGERGSFDSLRDRRGGSGDSPNGAVERPRLNLQPRTLPVTLPPPPPVEQQNGDAKAELVKPEIAPRSKGANPFGNARPREEVLKEKGLDWKELDEKLEASKIKEEEQRPAAAAAPFGKRGFGSGGWGGGAQEERAAWRKPAGSETSRPESADSKEDGAVEAVEAAEAENKEEAQV